MSEASRKIDFLPLWQAEPGADDEAATQYMSALLTVSARNQAYKKLERPGIEATPKIDVFSALEEAVLERSKNFGPNAKILSTGAGLAVMEISLVERGLTEPHIYVTDAFNHYYPAESTAQEKGYSNIFFGLADARALPFEPNQFDLEVAAFYLYHIENPHLAIREMLRTLKPGGKGLVSSRGTGNMATIWYKYLPMMTEYLNKSEEIIYVPPKSWYANCDPAMTRRLLEEEGAVNIRSIYKQKSPEDMIWFPASDWGDMRTILTTWKDSIRPVPPELGALLQIIDGPIKDDFMQTAKKNDGYFPLEVDQEVFEFEKPLNQAA